MPNKYDFLDVIIESRQRRRRRRNEENKIYYNEKNIIKTTRDIICEFETNNQLLLYAPTQSGKSEVMNRILGLSQKYQNNLNNLGLHFDNIYIIICASSIELKESIKRKTKDFSKKRKVYHLKDYEKLTKIIVDELKYNDSTDDSNYDSNYDSYDSYDNIEELERFGIHDLDDLCSNSLIILDECHANQAKTGTLNKFLKSVFDYYNKIIDGNGRAKPKILNISATPYQHCIKDYQIIKMQPGEGYLDVETLYLNKRIKTVYKLTEKEINKIFDTDKIKNKYVIIRNNGNNKEIKNNLIKIFKKRKIEHEFVEYNMKNKIDINKKYLNKKPLNKVVVIFIKNFLRMGVSINTDHIYCMHEGNTNTNAETTLQGLLGRSLGYKKNRDIIIYCDKEKVKEHMNWIKDFEKDYIPKAKYININKNLNKESRLCKNVIQ